jgi:Ca-activated chloride channel family protein
MIEFKRLIFSLSLFVAVILCAPSISSAKSEAGIVNNANKLYNDGKYDEALEGYSEAESLLPESDAVNFNKGAALYKKYEYEKAVGHFSKALTTNSPGLEAKATYNIGNSKYKLGKTLEYGEQEAAAKLYREALDYYKRTIELNQEDEDAKFNHEFVEKELKALQEKQQQQQQQQQQQEKQEQEKQDSQGRQQPQQGRQEEDEEGSDREEEHKDRQEPGQKEEQDQQEGSRPQPQEPEPDQMSEEEAKMLLDAHKQQEGPEVQMQRDRTHYEVLKDW